jgi:deazaflavin-dependent oxidoreductase (nitroreductase family)
MRRFFHFLNKFFMVPIYRLGLGPLFGNPFTGYILVLKVIGRKTGKLRFAPVNYAILNGNIYCLSGFGKSDWYRNLLVHPSTEVILPGGTISAAASVETDPAIRIKAVRKVLQNGGFAGFFEGFNPFRVSDEDLLQKTADLPLIRLSPQGLGNGASDPGGWAWIWMPVVLAALVAFLRYVRP